MKSWLYVEHPVGWMLFAWHFFNHHLDTEKRLPTTTMRWPGKPQQKTNLLSMSIRSTILYHQYACFEGIHRWNHVWLLGLTTPECYVSFQIRLSQLIWDFTDLKFGRSRVQKVCWGSEIVEEFGSTVLVCVCLQNCKVYEAFYDPV